MYMKEPALRIIRDCKKVVDVMFFYVIIFSVYAVIYAIIHNINPISRVLMGLKGGRVECQT